MSELETDMLFSDFLRDVEASIRERGIEPPKISLTYTFDASIPDSYDGEWRWSHRKRSVRLEHTLEDEPKIVFVWFDGREAAAEHSSLRLDKKSVDQVADQIVSYLLRADRPGFDE